MSTKINKKHMAILNKIMNGDTNPVIADALDCTVKSVEHNIKSLMLRFQANNRTELIIKAIKAGVITTGGK